MGVLFREGPGVMGPGQCNRAQERMWLNEPSGDSLTLNNQFLRSMARESSAQGERTACAWRSRRLYKSKNHYLPFLETTSWMQFIFGSFLLPGLWHRSQVGTGLSVFRSPRKM